MELVKEAHFIISLAEFEKSIDIDYPSLRRELGFDPRTYRPMAVRLAGALVVDRELCHSKNHHDLCVAVSDSTYNQIVSNEQIMNVLRLEIEDIRLLSNYLGRLVVYIRDYIVDRIDSMLMISSYYPLIRATTAVSDIMQFGPGDDLAIHCEVEFQDPTPKALGHDRRATDKHAPQPVVSTQSVGEGKAPWAGDAKW